MHPDHLPFPGVLAAIATLALDTGVSVLLVGATARDIALAAENLDTALRATNDLDLAVAVEDETAFKRLTAGLTPAQARHPHKFVIDGVEVDIVPFGGIESNERTITWPDGTVMNTLGLAESLRSPLSIDLGDGHAILVASIAAQVALKLFAWADRRHLTERDAVDLRTLVLAYSDGHRLDDVYADDRIDVLAAYDYEVQDAGAHQLGDQIRCHLGDEVAQRCLHVLADKTGGHADLVRAMRGDVGVNDRVLTALQHGLAGTGPGTSNRHAPQ